MTNPTVATEIQQAAVRLLRAAGDGDLETIIPLQGGRNNRVYRVAGKTSTGILKEYFNDSVTGHDRFATELAWYRYCAQQHIRQMPELWGANEETRCALFQEIPGRKLRPGEVTDEHVRQAADFFRAVNSNRRSANMPSAADSCFTLPDYQANVERRLEKLSAVPTTDAASEALHRWLTTLLLPTWSTIQANFAAAFSAEEFRAELPAEQRCVSPSDFGFHNAILHVEGKLWFLDFEYAGWDDPAKMVCDFFWQVDLPAPRSSLPVMMNAVQEFGPDVTRRIEALFPLFGVKWCAIVLNNFLSDGQRRQTFAAGETANSDRRMQQLEIAERILDVLRQDFTRGS